MSTEDREERRLTVRFPGKLPVLTPEVSRILLDILIDITETEVPDGPTREVTRDC
jgi:hypothetical protein